MFFLQIEIEIRHFQRQIHVILYVCKFIYGIINFIGNQKKSSLRKRMINEFHILAFTVNPNLYF